MGTIKMHKSRHMPYVYKVLGIGGGSQKERKEVKSSEWREKGVEENQS